MNDTLGPDAPLLRLLAYITARVGILPLSLNLVEEGTGLWRRRIRSVLLGTLLRYYENSHMLAYRCKFLCCTFLSFGGQSKANLHFLVGGIGALRYKLGCFCRL